MTVGVFRWALLALALPVATAQAFSLGWNHGDSSSPQQGIALGWSPHAASTSQGINLGWGSRAMDQDAKKDLRAQVQDHRAYAWDRPACIRYRTPHPDLLILGDSIFDGWSGYLLHVFPGAFIDARVGRQFSTGVADYQALLQYRGIARIRTLVIELGTNGAVSPAQLRHLMALAGPNRQVFWITPSVPRPWQREVLQVAHWAAGAYPTLHLVRWHRYAIGHPQWFWPDQVHPNWAGAQAIVGLLQRSLESAQNR